MDMAIVGGGAAAVGLLDALAVAGLGEPGTVTVFEPSAHLWRGRPYGPDLDAVRVNAPPAIMSIRHGDFGHYAAWLGERGSAYVDELLGQPLVPRALYGDYLAHTADAALAALGEAGWGVRVVPDRVTGVDRPGGRLLLRTEAAGKHEATHVVVCVGAGAPSDLYGLDGAPGYISDPYPLAGTLDRVEDDDEVAVIGSGLTAVDVAVSLAARGHAGPITLLSRSGVLPHVWQRPTGRRPRHLTVERVTDLHQRTDRVGWEDLIGLLRAELAEAGEDFEAFTGDLLATGDEDPVRRLRRQIGAVADPSVGRRMLQEAAHTVGPYVWRLLPDSDRARLRSHLRTAISVASPMVPVNAAVLLRLLDAGQLTLVRGIRGMEAVKGRFRVHGGDRGGFSADVVINAVNSAPPSVPDAARQLVGSMVDTGLASLHPSGGAVPADPRVHVVGDLSGGGSFVTASIPGLAVQAARVAQALGSGRPLAGTRS
ncbi:FAD/NAD(P)-binding protein [Streptomyces sp. NPDC126514]|uniref:FAD/NAD(P)-binding protein n=1 Tax=Streptomyces sp. NPDC126514 TaxID=3155210 RepID=UPI0033202EEE